MQDVNNILITKIIKIKMMETFDSGPQKCQNKQSQECQEIVLILNGNHNFILPRISAVKSSLLHREVLDKGLRVYFL